ncbi:sulfotransferase [Alteromonas sp. H39]|uniref:sulfotransferase n=1 Tax=Alteromonas sp. H39 TaxID=3389876 RepID=UPI0039E11146
MLTRLKTTIKTRLSDLLIRLLQEQDVKNWLDVHRNPNSAFCDELSNAPSPYPDLEYQDKQSNQKPIIITSRFRSGSTLLWNVFRQSGLCTAYYEPFNERKWFAASSRGEFVDNTHRGVKDYWEEFSGLSFLEQYYQDHWIDTNLLMTPAHYDAKMKAYIDALIDVAAKRPVMQFNRIDFRLPWLRANYPQAKYVHLYRHPRDQWCSFLTNPDSMSADTIETTYEDNFYLNSWCDDLQTYFPFLNRSVTPHPYQRFYFLWKLSYLFGKKYCDTSISYEALTSNPKETIALLFTALDMQPENLDELADIISSPAAGRWKKYADDKWFADHEEKCERILSGWLSNV